ncbi:RHS repeat domain-containing protein [[Pseudomonas] boreopolis]|uniref:RHS repeat domain-containing protein n=1 Tax=Xanthomonas boreopolis TaxID=86183 RepID=UPI003DA01A34
MKCLEYFVSFFQYWHWGLTGDIVAQTVEAVEYIHTNALGSIAAITDANGNVIERREYEPYGSQLSPAVQDGPGYTGHVQDATTGLIYMQQRYYDPELGVFDSVDPVTAYSNGDMRFFTRYAYAFNNPYKFNDPDGRCPLCMPIVLGGGGGALVDYAIQKAVNPDKPVNRAEIAVAGVAGAISGGVGGVLVGAVARGSVTVGQAVAVQTFTNAATGAGSMIAQNSIEGKPISLGEVGAATAGSVVGGAVASGIGVAAGDFAGAAAKGTLQRMANSSAPGAPNIASTTASTGVAIPRQGMAQAVMSQNGQASAQIVVGAAQKELEKK